MNLIQLQLSYQPHLILCFLKVFPQCVIYREFSRMVYGVLGAKRIPLPACVYHSIRKQFPLNKDEEHAGFESDDEES